MNVVLSLLGVAGAVALIAASFLFVFASATAQRLLKASGMVVGLTLFLLLAAWELERALGQIASVLAVAVISLIAYFVRARRARHAQRSQRLRGLERTPVMPRHLGDSQ